MRLSRPWRKERSEEGKPNAWLLSEEATQAQLLKEEGVKQSAKPLSPPPLLLPPHGFQARAPLKPDPGKQEKVADGCPQPTFWVFTVNLKCHSLVIDLHVDCVIGLKEPSDLAGN